MKNNVLFGTVGGLLVGLLAGYIIGFEVHDSQARGAAPQGMGQAQGMPPGMGQAPQAPPQGGMSQATLMEYQQRIDMNQRLAAQDPKNAGIWMALGNDYSDSNQLPKAIDAYNTSLKLAPGNPDVITDLGVVYEKLQDYDRALASFEQAQQVAPTHLQSLFNIGVISAYRKNDPARAIKAWKKVIELSPGSQQAAEARQRLASLGAK